MPTSTPPPGTLGKKPPCVDCICIPICRQKKIFYVIHECPLVEEYYGNDIDHVVRQDRTLRLMKALKHPSIFNKIDTFDEESKNAWLKKEDYEYDT